MLVLFAGGDGDLGCDHAPPYPPRGRSNRRRWTAGGAAWSMVTRMKKILIILGLVGLIAFAAKKVKSS